MFTFTESGSFKNTEAFLQKMSTFNVRATLEPLAQAGVDALSQATPSDTGLAGRSWTYRIQQNAKGLSIEWHNTDIENGFPVVIRLQTGYGTGTGGYVRGRDYINPAIRPIFDQIAEQVWKAVTSA